MNKIIQFRTQSWRMAREGERIVELKLLLWEFFPLKPACYYSELTLCVPFQSNNLYWSIESIMYVFDFHNWLSHSTKIKTCIVYKWELLQWSTKLSMLSYLWYIELQYNAVIKLYLLDTDKIVAKSVSIDRAWRCTTIIDLYRYCIMVIPVWV